MKVSDFKEFTSVWNLASLDDGSEVLTFQVEAASDMLSISFSGMHVGAVRIWPLNDVSIEGLAPDTPFSVSGSLLHGTLALFSDTEDLAARIDGTNLHLRAGGRQASLREHETGGARFVLPQIVVQTRCVIDRAELGPKLNMLAAAAARTLDRPALTGINVSTSRDGRLVLRATDGQARACLLSQEVREMEGESFGFTAPAADLSIALQECERIVTMELADGASILHLNDAITFVRLSLLQGDYPSFQHLPRKFESRLIIPSSMIDTVTKAAALIDQNGLVTLAARDGQLGLATQDQQKGWFSVAVGPTEEEDFEMHFDAEYMSQVAHASGIETVLQKAASNQPIMVSGEGWYYWLTSVVRTS